MKAYQYEIESRLIKMLMAIRMPGEKSLTV